MNAVESLRRHPHPKEGSGAPRRGLAPVGAVLTMVVALWLGLGHMILDYPLTAVTRDTVYRHEGVAVVAFLLGFLLYLRPEVTAAAVTCLALGVLVVAFGLWLPHETEVTRINETVTGVCLVVAALVAGAARTRA